MLVASQINTKSADFKNIKRVYRDVFPRVERLPLAFLKMRAKSGEGEFVSLYDDGQWVGFFYTVMDRRMAYIFYLAVDPRYQSQGYGSQLLTIIKESYPGKVVCLSAEKEDPGAVNNDQRIRRQRFYAQNGFQQAGFCTVEKGGVVYDCLTTGAHVKPQDYQRLLDHFVRGHKKHYLPYRIVRN